MIDRMANLRAGFLTTRACGTDGIYELKIKFQSLEELDAADSELRAAFDREEIDGHPLTGNSIAAPGAAIAAREQKAVSEGEIHLTQPALHPATLDLVQRFSKALAEKLAAAEKKYGYSDGWLQPDWMDECRAKLLEHIDKGDPRDVAAYCAFLWHHGESTSALSMGNGWPQYIAGIIETYIQQDRTDEDRETGIAKIIERRLYSLAVPVEQAGVLADDSALLAWGERHRIGADVKRLRWAYEDAISLAGPGAAIAARGQETTASKMEVDSWRRSLLVWREASSAELIENTAGLKQCLSNAARLLLDHPALASRQEAPAASAQDECATCVGTGTVSDKGFGLLETFKDCPDCASLAARSPATVAQPVTDEQMFQIIRGTGYVTRGQASEIVELLRAAPSSLEHVGKESE